MARVALTDEAARVRFVEYTHGLIRELMTQYGKIDVLWYDVDWPLSAGTVGIREDEQDGVRAAAGHHRQQPQRPAGGLHHAGTAHHSLPKAGRAWETCMTMNDSWGYQKADNNWKSPQTIVRNLVTCAHDTGKLSPEYRPQG